MARMLTIAEYGLLASLISFSYIIGIFSESIQTIIARYSSSESNPGKLKNILKKTTRKSTFISTILFLSYLILAIPMSSILNIDYALIAINGLIIFTSFLIPITRGMMQGRKRFFSLGSNLIVESLSKLVFAVILVFLGWKVYGALVAFVLSIFLSYFMSFLSLKDVVKSKEATSSTIDIYNYSKNVFFIMITILTFYSIDIIIARAVFSNEVAGYYAIASILSKTIFWGTQPISRALLPIEAGENAKSKHYQQALFLLIAVISSALMFIYFFPDIIIRIFSGKEIYESSQILFYLCLGTGILSITNLNVISRISRGAVKRYYLFPAFIVIESILLIYFSGSLIEFSLAFLSASIIFLIGSILLLGARKYENHNNNSSLQ